MISHKMRGHLVVPVPPVGTLTAGRTAILRRRHKCYWKVVPLSYATKQDHEATRPLMSELVS